ncbi:ACT domain-containing protein [Bradyrhizobium sp. Gha]|uniref:ACT domain-containing protein n=1 Tax=Bradyrhizobium sp. Gha TaxID=1855318 RepID=UPI000B811699|nr:ACT domain-containing protein [Bradyrhizobium sp. Gha]
MTGERDLDALLQNMKPEMLDGIFVFCTIAPSASIPAFISPILTFREREGATLVISREQAEAAGLPYALPSRLITLTVHSALDAVGYLAAITTRLAAAGFSVNAVSAVSSRSLFVPTDRAHEAMAMLEELSRTKPL